MKVLILAAGYATRLYPLTRDQPKALLPVRGRPLLDQLVEQLRGLPDLEELWLVTNHRFADDFRSWAATVPRPAVRVLDDGSTTPETRRGAVADIAFALEQLGIPEQGLCVCAADNLVMFPLARAARAFVDRGQSTIVVLEERDRGRLSRTGVVVLDDAGRVVRFQEKPSAPASTLTSPAFYFLTARSLRQLNRYVDEVPGRPDALGNFIAWLARHEPVYGERLSGRRIDVGCLEEYLALANGRTSSDS